MLVLPLVACLFAACVGASSDAPDNRGTEFIIGFMDSGRSSVDARLFISTASSENVEVKVTSPRFLKHNAMVIDETFNITYGEMRAVDLDQDIAADKDELDSKGILVEATEEISVHTEYRSNHENDGYMAIPTNALGTEYISVSYSPSRKETQFLIIATEDATTVEITMPDNDDVEIRYLHNNYLANDTITVQMQKYDSWQVQSHRGDLTGTLISSNKPISVFSGNEETNVGLDKSFDHLVEQLPAVSTWGKQFAFVSTPGRTDGDVYRFVAAEDGTNVEVSCSGGFSDTFIIDARKYQDIDTLTNGVCNAQSDKGVMLVQFIKSQQNRRDHSDPSMIVIYPIEQFTSAYSFATPISLDSKREYQAYITIVVKDSEKDDLLLDGEPLPVSTFVSVPNSPLVGTHVEITEGAHILQHTNPTQTFGGMIYGAAEDESYGMPMGARMANINVICTPTASQVGDGIDNDCDGQIDEELCAPSTAGADEDGDGSIDEDCAQVNGNWAEWGDFSDCSVTCAVGTMTRTRECNDLSPQGPGFYCWGEDSDMADCDTNIACPSAPDNRGTEYILAFMENRKGNTEVELFVTTSRQHDVSVKVTSPKYFNRDGNMMVDEEFTVTAGYIHNLELDQDMACSGTELDHKGIHVEADDEIVVYGTNLETSSNDGFLGLPVDVLGTEYYTVSYTPSNDDNEFLIVATEDNTEVQILLPNDDDVEIKVREDVYRDNNKRRKRDINSYESMFNQRRVKRSSSGSSSSGKSSKQKSKKGSSSGSSGSGKSKSVKIQPVSRAKSVKKSTSTKAKSVKPVSNAKTVKSKIVSHVKTVPKKSSKGSSSSGSRSNSGSKSKKGSSSGSGQSKSVKIQPVSNAKTVKSKIISHVKTVPKKSSKGSSSSGSRSNSGSKSKKGSSPGSGKSKSVKIQPVSKAKSVKKSTSTKAKSVKPVSNAKTVKSKIVSHVKTVSKKSSKGSSSSGSRSNSGSKSKKGSSSGSGKSTSVKIQPVSKAKSVKKSTSTKAKSVKPVSNANTVKSKIVSHVKTVSKKSSKGSSSSGSRSNSGSKSKKGSSSGSGQSKSVKIQPVSNAKTVKSKIISHVKTVPKKSSKGSSSSGSRSNSGSKSKKGSSSGSGKSKSVKIQPVSRAKSVKKSTSTKAKSVKPVSNAKTVKSKIVSHVKTVPKKSSKGSSSSGSRSNSGSKSKKGSSSGSGQSKLVKIQPVSNAKAVKSKIISHVKTVPKKSSKGSSSSGSRSNSGSKSKKGSSSGSGQSKSVKIQPVSNAKTVKSKIISHVKTVPKKSSKGSSSSGSRSNSGSKSKKGSSSGSGKSKSVKIQPVSKAKSVKKSTSTKAKSVKPVSNVKTVKSKIVSHVKTVSKKSSKGSSSSGSRSNSGSKSKKGSSSDSGKSTSVKIQPVSKAKSVKKSTSTKAKSVKPVSNAKTVKSKIVSHVKTVSKKSSKGSSSSGSRSNSGSKSKKGSSSGSGKSTSVKIQPVSKAKSVKKSTSTKAKSVKPVSNAKTVKSKIVSHVKTVSKKSSKGSSSSGSRSNSGSKSKKGSSSGSGQSKSVKIQPVSNAKTVKSKIISHVKTVPKKSSKGSSSSGSRSNSGSKSKKGSSFGSGKSKSVKIQPVSKAKSVTKSTTTKAKSVKPVSNAKTVKSKIVSQVKTVSTKSSKGSSSSGSRSNSGSKSIKGSSSGSGKSKSVKIQPVSKAKSVKKSTSTKAKSVKPVSNAKTVKSKIVSHVKTVSKKSSKGSSSSGSRSNSGSKSKKGSSSSGSGKSVKSTSASKSKSVKSTSASKAKSVKSTSASKAKSVKSTSASKSKSVKSTSAPKSKSVKSKSASKSTSVKSKYVSNVKSVKSTSASKSKSFKSTSASKAKSVKSTSASKSKSVKSTSASKSKSVKSTSASKSKSVKSTSASKSKSVKSTSASKSKSVKSTSASKSKSVKSTSASKSKSVKSTSASKAKSVKSKSASKSTSVKSKTVSYVKSVKSKSSKGNSSGSSSGSISNSGSKSKSSKSKSASKSKSVKSISTSKSKSSKSKSSKSSKSASSGSSAVSGSVQVLQGDYEMNDVITLSLDRFDTFQAQSRRGDTTGTRIVSNKPIAVFSGNVRAYVLPRRSWDHLVEQLVPVQSWGKTFAMVPTPERTNTGDTIRFVSAVANTEIWVTCSDGFEVELTVDDRQYEEIDIASEAMCYVEATEGIMVALFVKSETDNNEPTDPSMILIPPIGQYGAAYSFTTPKNPKRNRDYQSYVNFMVKDATKDGLLLDGMPLPANTVYNPIPETQLVGGFVKVDEGAHTLAHESPIEVFGAVLYGAAKQESYGMPLGMRLAEINVPCFPSTMSLGDGINNDCDDLIDEELCGNGIDDDGDGVEDEDCAPNPPVNGNWSDWTDWSDCSEPCGDVGTYGNMSRTRDCTNPTPSEDGMGCVGNDTEIETCSHSILCLVDGGWSQWENWTSCSVSCDLGTRQRYRNCDDPEPYGAGSYCAGDDSETGVCDTQVICPVHGGLSDWGAWSACPVTCGMSTATRTRSCDNPTPQHGGTDCVGSLNETKSCDSGSVCPGAVDGDFSAWTTWGSCSVTCGNGIKDRNRTCDSPAPSNGGNDCVGDTSETTVCDAGNCPIDGDFSAWTTWGSCSVTCGNGTKDRTRSCDNPAPQHGGNDCVGDTSESTTCDEGNCPIEGGFSVWGAWSACPVTCGTSSATRTRSCDNPTPQHGGADCVGDTSETQACDSGTVCAGPVDGGFTTWTTWGSCSVTCGAGTKDRSRSCDSPPPQNGGNDCVGDTSETTACDEGSCPIDGGFSVWGSWSACPVTCGISSATRTRSCDNPTPQHGGADCVGDTSETESCDSGTVCAGPVDGGFTTWTTWGSCSVTCGAGTKDRSRSCDSPPPQNGGNDCVGDTSETTACDEGSCPIDGGFSVWGSWSTCPVTCGTSSATRTRSCDNPTPQHGGADCVGDTSETQACDSGTVCAGPVDGGFTAWTTWGSCSETCGAGTKDRSRSCDSPPPQNGGNDCVGDTSETTACDDGSCPIDGGFSVWGSWSACPVTCGTSSATRTRSCDNPTPQHGGADCVGDTSETQACDSGTACAGPVDGGFSAWTTWGSCSVTCGAGSKSRSRACDSPPAQNGGNDCVGVTSETIACDEGSCPGGAPDVDGNWGNWQNWIPCTKTCGGGVTMRTRECDSPAQSGNGLYCVGTAFETGNCKTANCPSPYGGQSGAYVSKCPNGFFTCKSGSIVCIQEIFRCDCAADCEDGTDEDESWAACTAKQQKACMNSASAIGAWNGIFVFLLAVHLIARALYWK